MKKNVNNEPEFLMLGIVLGIVLGTFLGIGMYHNQTFYFLYNHCEVIQKATIYDRNVIYKCVRNLDNDPV